MTKNLKGITGFLSRNGNKHFPRSKITFIYANEGGNAGCYRFILSIISLRRYSRAPFS